MVPIKLSLINMNKKTTNSMKERVFFRDKGICQYCKEPIAESIRDWWSADVDHIDPTSSAEWIHNALDNLALSCRSCNVRKMHFMVADSQSRDEAIRMVQLHIKKRNQDDVKVLDGLREWWNLNLPEYISPKRYERNKQKSFKTQST